GVVDVARDDRAYLFAQELIEAVSSLRQNGLPPRSYLRLRDSRNRLLAEALDDVAFFELVEGDEPDPAFEAGRHFAHIVAEAAQRLDPIRLDDQLAAAVDTRAAADDAAVRDVGTGDRLASDAEDLADLGATLDNLHLLRFEHARQGGLHFLGQPVDDVV